MDCSSPQSRYSHLAHIGVALQDQCLISKLCRPQVQVLWRGTQTDQLHPRRRFFKLLPRHGSSAREKQYAWCLTNRIVGETTASVFILYAGEAWASMLMNLRMMYFCTAFSVVVHHRILRDRLVPGRLDPDAGTSSGLGIILQLAACRPNVSGPSVPSRASPSTRLPAAQTHAYAHALPPIIVPAHAHAVAAASLRLLPGCRLPPNNCIAKVPRYLPRQLRTAYCCTRSCVCPSREA